MKFKKYYIESKDKKSNCIIRTFCKLFDESYEDVYEELCRITKEKNCDSYNDIEVFEEYLNNKNMHKIEYGKDSKIKDLKLDNNSYVVFCYDKKDYYHMIPIIDNTIYDKDDKCLDLYTITIYK